VRRYPLAAGQGILLSYISVKEVKQKYMTRKMGPVWCPGAQPEG